MHDAEYQASGAAQLKQSDDGYPPSNRREILALQVSKDDAAVFPVSTKIRTAMEVEVEPKALRPIPMDTARRALIPCCWMSERSR